MKIIRIDKLGRIVIPVEHRKTLNLKEGSLLELSFHDSKILITAHIKQCKLCGANLKDFEDLAVCSECIRLPRVKGAVAKRLRDCFER